MVFVLKITVNLFKSYYNEIFFYEWLKNYFVEIYVIFDSHTGSFYKRDTVKK